MNSFTERLSAVIPGGAHTYSRGKDQFSDNTPEILLRGKGAYVYDQRNKEFLDYGMALRAVNIGYADEEINQAAIKQIKNGNNLTRPSFIELEAAELLVDLIESVEMVKFAKNGSSAVSAAVKLARAYTGRVIVARCSNHPFFSYDDWFIGSTEIKRGIPESTIKQITQFPYNEIKALEELFEKNFGKIACVVLEPSTIEHPKPSIFKKGENYLHDVKRLCEKHGAVFILDEMITGFRWSLEGAQKFYNIKPDLCTFGKAMANGFSVAAIGGKKEIMSIGSIDSPGQERVFLLSTTHGAEMSGLGAFVKTVEIMKREKVIEHFWNYGKALIEEVNKISEKKGLGDFFKIYGIECSPNFLTLDKNKQTSFQMRTLFQQEMVKNNIIMPWIALSYSHQKMEFEKTLYAIDKALDIYGFALENGVENYLKGHTIKPVFRRYN